MPFKPRLVNVDDASVDAARDESLSAAVPPVSSGLSPAELAELPAELQMLAEQLMDDADHLANQYPANAERSAIAELNGSRAARGAVGSQVPWGRVTAAIVVVVGSFWGSTKLARRWEVNQTVPLTFENVSQDHFASSEPVAASSPVVSHVARDNRPAAVETQPNPTSFPAMFFQDLSAPEQEGLLDLLEDEVLTPSSVSI